IAAVITSIAAVLAIKATLSVLKVIGKRKGASEIINTIAKTNKVSAEGQMPVAQSSKKSKNEKTTIKSGTRKEMLEKRQQVLQRYIASRESEINELSEQQKQGKIELLQNRILRAKVLIERIENELKEIVAAPEAPIASTTSIQNGASSATNAKYQERTNEGKTSSAAVEEIVEKLNISQADELVSIGPGLPNSYIGSVWEQAFLKRNGKVRVYQPDTKINQAWQQYGISYPERVTVLTPAQSRFESNQLAEGSARFVVAMSIFSDPVFFQYSHYDLAKREHIYTVTPEGDLLISAVAKILAKGGYFIYGWHSPAETLGGNTDGQEPKRAEEGLRILQNKLAARGLQLVKKYEGKDGDTPNESHAWEVYEVTVSSSASSAASVNVYDSQHLNGSIVVGRKSNSRGKFDQIKLKVVELSERNHSSYGAEQIVDFANAIARWGAEQNDEFVHREDAIQLENALRNNDQQKLYSYFGQRSRWYFAVSESFESRKDSLEIEGLVQVVDWKGRHNGTYLVWWQNNPRNERADIYRQLKGVGEQILLYSINRESKINGGLGFQIAGVNILTPLYESVDGMFNPGLIFPRQVLEEKLLIPHSRKLLRILTNAAKRDNGAREILKNLQVSSSSVETRVTSSAANADSNGVIKFPFKVLNPKRNAASRRDYEEDLIRMINLRNERASKHLEDTKGFVFIDPDFADVVLNELLPPAHVSVASLERVYWEIAALYMLAIRTLEHKTNGGFMVFMNRADAQKLMDTIDPSFKHTEILAVSKENSDSLESIDTFISGGFKAQKTITHNFPLDVEYKNENIALDIILKEAMKAKNPAQKLDPRTNIRALTVREINSAALPAGFEKLDLVSAMRVHAEKIAWSNVANYLKNATKYPNVYLAVAMDAVKTYAKDYKDADSFIRAIMAGGNWSLLYKFDNEDIWRSSQARFQLKPVYLRSAKGGDVKVETYPFADEVLVGEITIDNKVAGLETAAIIGEQIKQNLRKVHHTIRMQPRKTLGSGKTYFSTDEIASISEVREYALGEDEIRTFRSGPASNNPDGKTSSSSASVKDGGRKANIYAVGFVAISAGYAAYKAYLTILSSKIETGLIGFAATHYIATGIVFAGIVTLLIVASIMLFRREVKRVDAKDVVKHQEVSDDKLPEEDEAIEGEQVETPAPDEEAVETDNKIEETAQQDETGDSKENDAAETEEKDEEAKIDESTEKEESAAEAKADTQSKIKDRLLKGGLIRKASVALKFNRIVDPKGEIEQMGGVSTKSGVIGKFFELVFAGGFFNALNLKRHPLKAAEETTDDDTSASSPARIEEARSFMEDQYIDWLKKKIGNEADGVLDELFARGNKRGTGDYSLYHAAALLGNLFTRRIYFADLYRGGDKTINGGFGPHNLEAKLSEFFGAKHGKARLGLRFKIGFIPWQYQTSRRRMETVNDHERAEQMVDTVTGILQGYWKGAKGYGDKEWYDRAIYLVGSLGLGVAVNKFRKGFRYIPKKDSTKPDDFKKELAKAIEGKGLLRKLKADPALNRVYQEFASVIDSSINDYYAPIDRFSQPDGLSEQDRDDLLIRVTRDFALGKIMHWWNPIDWYQALAWFLKARRMLEVWRTKSVEAVRSNAIYKELAYLVDERLNIRGQHKQNSIYVTIFQDSSEGSKVIYQAVVVIGKLPNSKKRIERRVLRPAKDADPGTEILYLVEKPGEDRGKYTRDWVLDFVEAMGEVVREKLSGEKAGNSYQKIVGPGLGVDLVRWFAETELSRSWATQNKKDNNWFVSLADLRNLERQANPYSGIFGRFDDNLRHVAGDVMVSGLLHEEGTSDEESQEIYKELYTGKFSGREWNKIGREIIAQTRSFLTGIIRGREWLSAQGIFRTRAAFYRMVLRTGDLNALVAKSEGFLVKKWSDFRSKFNGEVLEEDGDYEEENEEFEESSSAVSVSSPAIAPTHFNLNTIEHVAETVAVRLPGTLFDENIKKLFEEEVVIKRGKSAKARGRKLVEDWLENQVKDWLLKYEFIYKDAITKGYNRARHLAAKDVQRLVGLLLTMETFPIDTKEGNRIQSIENIINAIFEEIGLSEVKIHLTFENPDFFTAPFRRGSDKVDSEVKHALMKDALDRASIGWFGSFKAWYLWRTYRKYGYSAFMRKLQAGGYKNIYRRIANIVDKDMEFETIPYLTVTIAGRIVYKGIVVVREAPETLVKGGRHPLRRIMRASLGRKNTEVIYLLHYPSEDAGKSVREWLLDLTGEIAGIVNDHLARGGRSPENEFQHMVRDGLGEDMMDILVELLDKGFSKYGTAAGFRFLRYMRKVAQLIRPYGNDDGISQLSVAALVAGYTQEEGLSSAEKTGRYRDLYGIRFGNEFVATAQELRERVQKRLTSGLSPKYYKYLTISATGTWQALANLWREYEPSWFVVRKSRKAAGEVKVSRIEEAKTSEEVSVAAGTIMANAENNGDVADRAQQSIFGNYRESTKKLKGLISDLEGERAKREAELDALDRGSSSPAKRERLERELASVSIAAAELREEDGTGIPLLKFSQSQYEYFLRRKLLTGSTKSSDRESIGEIIDRGFYRAGLKERVRAIERRIEEINNAVHPEQHAKELIALKKILFGVVKISNLSNIKNINPTALFNNLVENGYIDRDGIIQEKLRKNVSESSQLTLDPVYNNKKQDIYKVLKQITSVSLKEKEQFSYLYGQALLHLLLNRSIHADGSDKRQKSTIAEYLQRQFGQLNLGDYELEIGMGTTMFSDSERYEVMTQILERAVYHDRGAAERMVLKIRRYGLDWFNSSEAVSLWNPFSWHKAYLVRQWRTKNIFRYIEHLTTPQDGFTVNNGGKRFGLIPLLTLSIVNKEYKRLIARKQELTQNLVYQKHEGHDDQIEGLTEEIRKVEEELAKVSWTRINLYKTAVVVAEFSDSREFVELSQITEGVKEGDTGLSVMYLTNRADRDSNKTAQDWVWEFVGAVSAIVRDRLSAHTKIVKMKARLAALPKDETAATERSRIIQELKEIGEEWQGRNIASQKYLKPQTSAERIVRYGLGLDAIKKFMLAEDKWLKYKFNIQNAKYLLDRRLMLVQAFTGKETKQADMPGREELAGLTLLSPMSQEDIARLYTADLRNTAWDAFGAEMSATVKKHLNNGQSILHRLRSFGGKSLSTFYRNLLAGNGNWNDLQNPDRVWGSLSVEPARTGAQPAVKSEEKKETGTTSSPAAPLTPEAIDAGIAERLTKINDLIRQGKGQVLGPGFQKAALTVYRATRNALGTLPGVKGREQLRLHRALDAQYRKFLSDEAGRGVEENAPANRYESKNLTLFNIPKALTDSGYYLGPDMFLPAVQALLAKVVSTRIFAPASNAIKVRQNGNTRPVDPVTLAEHLNQQLQLLGLDEIEGEKVRLSILSEFSGTDLGKEGKARHVRGTTIDWRLKNALVMDMIENLQPGPRFLRKFLAWIKYSGDINEFKRKYPAEYAKISHVVEAKTTIPYMTVSIGDDVVYKGLVVLKVDLHGKTRIERRVIDAERKIEVLYLIFNPNRTDESVRDSLFDLVGIAPAIVHEAILKRLADSELSAFEKLIGIGLGRRILRNFVEKQESWLGWRGVMGFKYLLYRRLLQEQAYPKQSIFGFGNSENLQNIAADVLFNGLLPERDGLVTKEVFSSRIPEMNKNLLNMLTMKLQQQGYITSEGIILKKFIELADDSSFELSSEYDAVKHEIYKILKHQHAIQEETKQWYRSFAARRFDTPANTSKAQQLVSKVGKSLTMSLHWYSDSRSRLYRYILNWNDNWERLRDREAEAMRKVVPLREAKEYIEPVTEDLSQIDAEVVLGRALDSGMIGAKFGEIIQGNVQAMEDNLQDNDDSKRKQAELERQISELDEKIAAIDAGIESSGASSPVVDVDKLRKQKASLSAQRDDLRKKLEGYRKMAPDAVRELGDLQFIGWLIRHESSLALKDLLRSTFYREEASKLRSLKEKAEKELIALTGTDAERKKAEIAEIEHRQKVALQKDQRMIAYLLNEGVWSPAAPDMSSPGKNFAKLLKMYFASLGYSDIDVEIGLLDYNNAPEDLPLLGIWHKLIIQLIEDYTKFTSYSESMAKYYKGNNKFWRWLMEKLDIFNDYVSDLERLWLLRLFSPAWWHNDGLFIPFIGVDWLYIHLNVWFNLPAPFNFFRHKEIVKLKLKYLLDVFKRGDTRKFIEILQHSQDPDIRNLYTVVGNILELRETAEETRHQLSKELARAKKDLKSLTAEDARAALQKRISELEEKILLLEPVLPIITLKRAGRIIDQRIVVVTQMTKKKTRTVVSKKLMELPDGRQFGLIELVRTKRESGQTMMDWMADLFSEFAGGVFRDIRAGITPLQVELAVAEKKLHEIADKESREAKKLKAVITGLTEKISLRMELEANEQKLSELEDLDNREARRINRRISTIRAKVQGLKGKDVAQPQEPNNEMEEIIRAGWVSYAEEWFLRAVEGEYKNFGIQTASLLLRHRRLMARMSRPVGGKISGEPAGLSAYRYILMKVNKPLGDFDINLDLFYFVDFNLRTITGEALIRSQIDINNPEQRAAWIRKLTEGDFRGKQNNQSALNLRDSMKSFLARKNILVPTRWVAHKPGEFFKMIRKRLLRIQSPIIFNKQSNFYEDMLELNGKFPGGWDSLNATERIFRTASIGEERQVQEETEEASVEPASSVVTQFTENALRVTATAKHVSSSPASSPAISAAEMNGAFSNARNAAVLGD
ncbi:MAG: hypothetical protein WC330_00005, partial [Candidatus Omnitrophota bacterium]